MLLDRDVSADEVDAAFEAGAHDGPLAGLLRYTTEPIVSAGMIRDDASCAFDASLTQASGRFVKAFGWYDNERGYTCRPADLTRLVGRKG